MTAPTPQAGQAPFRPQAYSTIPTDWLIRYYEEGSATCRNYSTLTMHVRTVASLVFAGGSGVILYKEMTGSDEWNFTFYAGLLMCIFTIMLTLTGWHYQTAFQAIRNELAKMEKVIHVSEGIWSAHLKMRGVQPDLLSSYGPYLVLGVSGLHAACLGAAKLEWPLWCLTYLVIVVLVMLLVASIVVGKREKPDGKKTSKQPA